VRSSVLWFVAVGDTTRNSFALFVTSAAEQRQNPSAVMDALHVFDKKLREPIGQKYMGARSTEDLTAEADPKQQSKNVTMNDANGLPVLPAKARDADKDKLSDKPKQVSVSGRKFAFVCCSCFDTDYIRVYGWLLVEWTRFDNMVNKLW